MHPLCDNSIDVSRRPKDEEATVITTIRHGSLRNAVNGAGEACLVLIHGPELGKQIPLRRTAPVDIGRHPSNDLALDQDSISRRHARIAWQQDRWHAIDLESTNGTFVNDEQIGDCVLKDGDQIKVGRVILKFLESGSLETSYHEEIHRLMTFDGLTGVHNKRYFHEAFEREISRCLRYDRRLCLILFDIDHFKLVNDEHGHIAGDAVLRQLAAVVSANVRRDDIFARVGGEEFAIVVPEAQLSDACTMAEKIRALVQAATMTADTIQIAVTISLGVAEFSKEQTADSLYARADACLYQAKQAGRNRVCW